MRRELYDLVWSTPVKTLSARFEMSDVALRKRCFKADIPVPQAGHWAKVRAGKKVVQPALPSRGPGMSDTIEFGRNCFEYWYPSDEELLGPLPDPPVFDEPLDVIRERFTKAIGKVRVPRDLSLAHHLIRKRLDEDNDRREAQSRQRYPSSWDAPWFDSPFEQRRLRILNALALVAGKAGAKPDIRGRKARDVSFSIHDVVVRIGLDCEADASAAMAITG